MSRYTRGISHTPRPFVSLTGAGVHCPVLNVALSVIVVIGGSLSYKIWRSKDALFRSSLTCSQCALSHQLPHNPPITPLNGSERKQCRSESRLLIAVRFSGLVIAPERRCSRLGTDLSSGNRVEYEWDSRADCEKDESESRILFFYRLQFCWSF
jgi:hypothetical protein